MSTQPIVDQFQDAINDVVSKYSDMDLTTAEAIGALHIVILDIYSRTDKDLDGFPPGDIGPL